MCCGCDCGYFYLVHESRDCGYLLEFDEGTENDGGFVAARVSDVERRGPELGFAEGIELRCEYTVMHLGYCARSVVPRPREGDAEGGCEALVLLFCFDVGDGAVKHVGLVATSISR